ncbi:glycosyltransferase family 4 protein [Candidatus Pelagibacter sp.]|nr:glycosyltransferase family 4 protein [Candidatus Pelagibacter sp.]
MKILFDYAIFFHQKHGGISRYFLNLQEQFLKNDNEVKVFAPIHQNIFLKENLIKNSFNLYLNRYPLYTRNLLKNFNHYTSKLFCNFYKPEIIHNTFFEKNITNKFKKIITVYDLIHEICYEDYENEKNYRPKQDALNNADQIICISNKTKEDLIDIYKIDEKKIDVIYLGIQKFYKMNEPTIKLNKPFLLYVGSRSKYKNFNNLIKAFSLSIKLQNDFDIICCGGGKFSELEQKNILNHKIHLSKIKQIDVNDDQLHYFYKNATALIYPSLYEGFGLPTIEAMSLGCPVISSNHSAIIEAVGDAAKQFNPNKSEEILSCIEDTVYSIENTKNYIKKGFARSKLFTWKKCSEETMSIYKKLL